MIYFAFLFLHIGLGWFIEFLGFSYTTAQWSKALVLLPLLWVYRKHFPMQLRWSFKAVFMGILIIGIWILIDPFYPYPQGEVPQLSTVLIIARIINSVIIAAIIEEFFTRFYLHRFVEDKNWQKVPLGKYSVFAFVVTAVFFGFSHNRWLAGLIAGILFNILYYHTKNMSDLVISHAVANALLSIYILITESYYLWF